MGTYKVLQDIEAEDKLFGPLTLKQFIFAGIAITCAYLCFMLLVRGLWPLTFALLPPMMASGFLAWPWSREQSTDVWLLAKLRFHIKPRRRIWDQSGINDLVTVTAPVRDDKQYTDGLSEGEVKSRLQALANTIDSRGWAVKNVNVNLTAQPGYSQAAGSDRLIDVNTLPQEVVAGEVSAADDILDEQNNPTAKNLSRMISATAAGRKQRIMERLKKPDITHPAAPASPQPDYWFMNQTTGQVPAGQAIFDGGVTVRPEEASPIQSASDDPAATSQLQAAQAQGSAAYGNMRTVQPVAATPTPATPVSQPMAPPSPKTPDPAILELANNDDLDVATIARQANKKVSDLGDDEVVVPLR